MGITTSSPVGEEDICWAAVIAREKKPPLFNGVEDGTGGHLKDVVPDVVMSGDAFSPEPTTQCMVTILPKSERPYYTMFQ